jgi:predicted metal-dependent peptidase
MSNTKLEQRLSTAYTKLSLREPFIAAAVLKLRREITDKVPTAATNGSVVKYNPTWCDTFGDEELFGLVFHESMHVVLLHMWRRNGRDPQLWNVANDALINKYAKDKGYQLPPGGVHIAWVTEDMDSEAVYERLKQDQKEQSKHGGGGFDGQGDLEDGLDATEAASMEATISAAAKVARECGDKSNLIDRVLGKVGQSKVPWQDVLRAMMTAAARNDYTYRRPSRRFIGQGLYLPSLYSEGVGGLAIGFDTSGSVSQRDCDRIAEEVRAIVDDLQPAFVEVIYCDTQIQSVQRFDQGDDLQLKPRGGGGTRFAPVFDHIRTSTDEYCGLIYFTDLEGPVADLKDPGIPVVWGQTTSRVHTVPFGTITQVTL